MFRSTLPRYGVSMQITIKRQLTSSSIIFHSHSHANGECSSHSHSHSHSHSQTQPEHPFASTDFGCGHSHATKIPKPNPLSDPDLRFDIDASGRKVLKLHPFQSVHAHDDPDFPELKELDLGGEDFEIKLNEKKQGKFSKIKQFFSLSPTLSAQPKSSAHSHSHSDGHSHTHGAHSLEELEFFKTGSFKKNPGVKITIVGLGVNIGMAATKFFAGTYFHSQALVADAVHSVGDTISDVLTLATVNSAVKIPSESFPLGFGKIETLGSLFVSSILLYAGIQIGWSSLIDILTPILPHSYIDILSSVPVHSHSHSHVAVPEVTSSIAGEAAEAHSHEHAHGVAEPVVREVANINAAWVALGSIVIKEWLYRTTRGIADRMGSKVLLANAWHHRVDSLTSVVALATISAGHFLNIYWLDSIGGLIVSIMVLKVGLSGVIQSFKELVDKAIPKSDPRYEDIEDKVNVLLMKNDSNLIIKDLILLPSGANMSCNLTIGVPKYNKLYENKLTLDAINKISENIKTGLHEETPTLKKVTVEMSS